MDSFQFSGNFPPKCQESSVSTILHSFMSMLLNGPHVQDQHDQESQASLTLSQLVCLNSKFRGRRSSTENTRHFKDRETPLPLYIGLNIHTQTRSKMLLNHLHKLGISVSYKRVTEVENSLASALCTIFEDDDVVCPSQLRKNLFTVGALDNIDHNLTSTTAQCSFDGISVFQFPTVHNSGICRDPIVIVPDKSVTDYSLPGSYTNVPAVTCKVKELVLPLAKCSDFNGHLEEAKAEEMVWIEHG